MTSPGHDLANGETRRTEFLRPNRTRQNLIRYKALFNKIDSHLTIQSAPNRPFFKRLSWERLLALLNM